MDRKPVTESAEAKPCCRRVTKVKVATLVEELRSTARRCRA